MEAFSTALALGGTPCCCLPAPCHLGSQLKSGSHRHAGEQMLNALHPFCSSKPPSLEPLPATQLQSDVVSSQ